LSPLI